MVTSQVTLTTRASALLPMSDILLAPDARSETTLSGLHRSPTSPRMCARRLPATQLVYRGLSWPLLPDYSRARRGLPGEPPRTQSQVAKRIGRGMSNAVTWRWSLAPLHTFWELAFPDARFAAAPCLAFAVLYVSSAWAHRFCRLCRMTAASVAIFVLVAWPERKSCCDLRLRPPRAQLPPARRLVDPDQRTGQGRPSSLIALCEGHRQRRPRPCDRDCRRRVSCAQRLQ